MFFVFYDQGPWRVLFHFLDLSLSEGRLMLFCGMLLVCDHGSPKFVVLAFGFQSRSGWFVLVLW